MTLEEGFDLVDVFLHGVVGAHAFELGPGVVLGPAHHIQHAGALAGHVAGTALLVVGVEEQKVVVIRLFGQRFNVLLGLLKLGFIGHYSHLLVGY